MTDARRGDNLPFINAVDVGIKPQNSAATNYANFETFQDNAGLLTTGNSGDGSGMLLLLPRGFCKFERTTGAILQRPRLIIRGIGERESIIEAGSNQSTADGYFWHLGIKDELHHGTWLQNLKMNCSDIVGLGGIYSNGAQEDSGLYRVAIYNVRDKGLHLQVPCENATVHGCEFFGSGLEQHNMCVHLQGAVSIKFRDVTAIAAQTGQSDEPAIFVDGCSLTMSNVHVEHAYYGIRIINADGGITITGVSGHHCNEVISYETGDRGLSVSEARPGQSVTHTIRYTADGQTTYVDGFVRNVILGDVNGKNIIVRPTTLPLDIAYAASITPDLARRDYVKVGTLTGNITVNNATNHAETQRVRIGFVQDATGGRTITWGSAYKGVTLAASGTANQRAWIEFTSDGTNLIQLAMSGWYS
jgi:hypothetical protein